MTWVSAAEWRLPTRCAPWNVSDLLTHVRVVIAWLPGMLAAPAPVRAEVSAVEYYRPDARFAPGTNAVRIALAQDHAAEQLSGAARADDFNATWQAVDRMCRAEPGGRVVRTRHGDPMLLSEFLLTRVVEVAVHGLDLADALGREPWLTSEAADLVQGLLLGPDGAAALEKLGWSQLRFLRTATGASRSPGRRHRTSAAWASAGSRWVEKSPTDVGQTLLASCAMRTRPQGLSSITAAASFLAICGTVAGCCRRSLRVGRSGRRASVQ